MFEGKLIPKIESALKNKETRCSKTRKVAFRLRRNATAKFTDRTFFSKKLVFMKKNHSVTIKARWAKCKVLVSNAKGPWFNTPIFPTLFQSLYKFLLQEIKWWNKDPQPTWFKARWSSGMILASGVTGSGLNSRTGPIPFWSLCIFTSN